MSNALGAAAATATFASILQNALDRAAADGLGPSSAAVVVGRPTATLPTGPVVHLYLYRVSTNASWANRDLAFRDSTGRLTEVPRAALTLHYLITFFGDEDALEAERLLGIVAAHLHSEPYLSRDLVTATVGDAATPFLAASDLADDLELVRLTPVDLSVDDLSRLWGALPAGAFGVSLAYEATPVLLEPEVQPSRALPVREAEITVVAGAPPSITSVELADDTDPPSPIEAGAVLLVRGANLAGATTRVEIDGAAVDNAAVSRLTDDSLRLTIPSGLEAGVRRVRVTHVHATSAAGTEQSSASNVIAVALRPRVDGASLDGTVLTVAVTPSVGAGQRAEVSLDPVAGGASVALAASVDGGALVVDTSGLDAGEHRVRARVDDVDSIPAVTGGVTVVVP